jgi:hypothetical protein
MATSDIERRGHSRYDLPDQIEYVLDPDTTGKVYKGVTIEVSYSGMRLYVFSLLPRGQKLTIRSALPISSQTATVKWIEKVEEGFYKTGLMFI